MSAQSSTLLPGKNVRGAAARALIALREERKQHKADLILQHRVSRGVFRSSIYSDDQMWDRMPAEVRKINDLFRRSDEHVLVALHNLAAAAVAHRTDFTVQVTADDFRLIAGFYKKSLDGKS